MPNVVLIPEHSPNIERLAGFVDGYPRETHISQADLGTAPLENGASINDHVVRKPVELNMTAEVSDQTAGGRAHVVDAWREILRLHLARETVQVYTEWATYPEMIIKEARGDRVGAGMTIQMTLLEVIRVDIAGTEDALLAANVSGAASERTSTVQRGRVAVPELTTEETDERNRLQRFFDSFKESVKATDNIAEDRGKDRLISDLGGALRKLPTNN